MNKLLTIGEVAQLFDIASSQIRFYERKGLIEPAVIGENGYRYYDFKAIDQMSIIVLLRALEIPVAEIKETMAKDQVDIQERIQRSREKVVDEIERLNNLLEKVDYMTAELGGFEEGQLRTLDFEERHMNVLSVTNVLNMSERELFEFFMSHDIPFVNFKHDLCYIRVDDVTHLYCMHDRDHKVKFKEASSYCLKAGTYLEWCLEIDDFEAVEDTLKEFDKKAEALGYQLVGERVIINELSSILYSTRGIPIKVQGRIQKELSCLC